MPPLSKAFSFFGRRPLEDIANVGDNCVLKQLQRVNINEINRSNKYNQKPTSLPLYLEESFLNALGLLLWMLVPLLLALLFYAVPFLPRLSFLHG